MTLKQLEYALALEKHGSYSRAAKSVGISQPAMSLQIQNLEAIVNVPLFDRTQKPIVPTYEGKLFLEKAQALLTEAAQLEDFAIELSEEFNGEVKIGVIPTLAPYLLPLFISEVNQKYPRLKVHIWEALTTEIIEGIKSGELNGGIISTPIQTSTKLSIHPLFYEKFLLFVSEQHPFYQQQEIDVKEIPLNDVWLLKEGNCFRDQVNNLCEIARAASLNSLFFYESNSIEALCRVVEYKGGITFLPELTTLHFEKEREHMIKEIKGKKSVREISLVHNPNEVRIKLLDKVAEVLLNNIPRNMLDKEAGRKIPTNIKV